MIEWINKVNEINPNGKIVLHGLSMGGGIVLNLSNKDLENVKCLIADAPSVSIKDFFINISQSVFKNNYEKIANYAFKRFKKEFGYDVSDFENKEIIASCKYPLLLSAGSEEHLDNLFEEIKKINPNETDIIILPGCNHGNGMYKETKLYQEKIIDFLNKYI